MTTAMTAWLEVQNILLAHHEHRVELRQRGDSLVMWAKLPPKKGHGTPTKQRISLGHSATERGLRDAVEAALLLQRKLRYDKFHWQDYQVKFWDKETIEKSLDRFKEEFMKEPKRLINPTKTKSNWDGAYKPYINRLKVIQESTNLPLDVELFQKTLESYEPNSAARVKCLTCIKRLAKQEKISLPEGFKELAQGYQPLRDGRLKYPSDEEIVTLREKIPNPKWRWLFSMMATYGLRTHEVFFCNIDQTNKHNAIVVGNETKTGSRVAYPLRPEWVDMFELKDVQMPDIKLDRTMRDISSGVDGVFKRYSLGNIPYSLRHAWAIRSIHYGLSSSVAAKAMGHTVNIHTKHYNFYLSRKDLDKAFDAINVPA